MRASELVVATDDVINRAEKLALEDRNAVLQAHVRRLIAVFQERDAEASNVAFAIGYTLFWIEDMMTEKADAQMWLTRAIELNPDQMFARYYLGALLYDERRFVEAIDVLSPITKLDGHAKIGLWRILNARSMVLCARARSGDIDISKLEKIAEQFSNDRDCDFDLPIQIVEYAVAVASRGTQNTVENEFLALVMRMLASPNLVEEFAAERSLIATKIGAPVPK